MSRHRSRFVHLSFVGLASVVVACADDASPDGGGVGGTGGASTTVGEGSSASGPDVGATTTSVSASTTTGQGGATTGSGGEGGAGPGDGGAGGEVVGPGGAGGDGGSGAGGDGPGGAGPGGSGAGGEPAGTGGSGSGGAGGDGGSGAGGAPATTATSTTATSTTATTSTSGAASTSASGSGAGAGSSGSGGDGGGGGAGGGACGDGIVDPGEACDDGDDVPGDGCHLCRQVEEIAAGRAHACARFSDGRIKCWGRNDWGQLGSPSGTVGDEPGEVEAQPDVDLGAGAFAVSLALGDDHSCALLATGEVKCWGANQVGQLGLGDTLARGDDPGEMGDALPSVDLGGYEAAQLLSGASFVCILTPTSRVRCWGGNGSGQLGLGSTTAVGATPDQLEDLTVIGLDAPVADLALGRSHACALSHAGVVSCWGENGAGQLGWGGTEDRGDEPGEIDDLAPVFFGSELVPVGVGAGATTSCALFDDGSTRCWGNLVGGKALSGDNTLWGNEPGEIGVVFPFADVGQQESIAQVAVSVAHGCFLTGSQRVKCGGRADLVGLDVDFGYSVGDAPDEIGDALPFVDLGTNVDVLQIVAGEDFTCALREDRTVVCWGESTFGQLGRGTTAQIGVDGAGMGDALVPVAIP